jgi:hypothetical protein
LEQKKKKPVAVNGVLAIIGDKRCRLANTFKSTSDEKVLLLPKRVLQLLLNLNRQYRSHFISA